MYRVVTLFLMIPVVIDCAITYTTPAGISATASSLAENSGSGASVYTVVSTTDNGPTTYSISAQTTANTFAIDGTSGAITVSSASPDHEAGASHVITVAAVDSDASPSSVTITVPIRDVNEFDPAFSSSSQTGTIVTAASPGASAGTYAATDSDTSQTLTYAISSGNTGTVWEVTSAGVVQVASGQTTDEATTPCYTLVVTATDDVATLRTATTTISIAVGTGTCSSAASLTATVSVLLSALLLIALK